MPVQECSVYLLWPCTRALVSTQDISAVILHINGAEWRAVAWLLVVAQHAGMVQYHPALPPVLALEALLDEEAAREVAHLSTATGPACKHARQELDESPRISDTQRYTSCTVITRHLPIPQIAYSEFMHVDLLDEKCEKPSN